MRFHRFRPDPESGWLVFPIQARHFVTTTPLAYTIWSFLRSWMMKAVGEKLLKSVRLSTGLISLSTDSARTIWELLQEELNGENNDERMIPLFDKLVKEVQQCSGRIPRGPVQRLQHKA